MGATGEPRPRDSQMAVSTKSETAITFSMAAFSMASIEDCFLMIAPGSALTTTVTSRPSAITPPRDS